MPNQTPSQATSKYDIQQLIFSEKHGIGEIKNVVVAEDLLIYYDVYFLENRLVPGVPEDELRELTFGEFLWYKDPIDGGRMIGWNTPLPLIAAGCLALAFIVSGFWVEGWWKLAPIAIGIAIPSVTIWQTWRQYIGKQV